MPTAPRRRPARRPADDDRPPPHRPRRRRRPRPRPARRRHRRRTAAHPGPDLGAGPTGRPPVVKPRPFRYERPATLDEALSLLAEHGEEARLLAGGQSLVPMLNLRLSSPAVIVDLNAVPRPPGRRAGAGG